MIGLAALSFGHHHGEIILRRRMTVVGSKFVPYDRSRKILRHALSDTVHHPKLELRGSVILMRCLLDPVCGYNQIRSYVVSAEIEHTKNILGLSFASLSGFRIPLECLARFDLLGIDRKLARIKMTQLQGRACMAIFCRPLQQLFRSGRIASHVIAL